MNPVRYILAITTELDGDWPGKLCGVAIVKCHNATGWSIAQLQVKIQRSME